VNVVVTGHRPQKLAPEQVPWIKDTLAQCLGALDARNTVAVSGMALGVDTWWVEAALALKIPVLAVVPFAGQERVWRYDDQQKYHALLAQCAQVEVLHPVPPRDRKHSAQLLFARNTWMSEHADLALAVWDGKPEGGTSHCVSELVTRKVPVMVLDPVARSFHTLLPA
jgi:uncharacterized phage-like protein YoqJ